MISGFDADQFCWLGERVHERLEFSRRTVLVARSADEELGLDAIAQEREIVNAPIDRDCGKAEGDQCGDSRVGVGSAQSYCGSEGKTGEYDRKRVFVLHPVEGGAHVFDFASAVRVFSFAQSGATKVEAEHGESKAVKCLHGVEDDFVVQSSTE